MYDLELNEWRRLLQKSRALYRKIEATNDLKEKEKLKQEHKKILEEARRIYNQIYKNLKINGEPNFK